MSSLPPRQNNADPHKLSTAGNLQQATNKVNRFAKRDPALYPLSFIVVGIIGVAGYFFMSKASQPEADKAFIARGSIVNPWDDKSKHDTHPSSVAAFKYRYMNKAGVMEDSPPAVSGDKLNISDATAHKFKTTL
ncbi:hypothetical protein P7C73_g466, partial [Tremellales sp. Uapishka_1]